MLDYVVVGLGLAGISFCEQLEKNGKSFCVINDDSQTSSAVAGGLYNPVILKRFTLAWNAKEQLSLVESFYKNLERKLSIKLDYKTPILRRFASIEEQNLWFEASDKEGLGQFLSLEIKPNENPCVDAPFGYGQVMHAGRIDTANLCLNYSDYLFLKEHLIQEPFDFESFHIHAKGITYKSINARQIVFAEGFGLKANPYFKYLPLQGSKGEYVIIKAPDLKEVNSIKSAIFCIPLGNDFYKIGANYEPNDKTNSPTQKAKKEILKKLNALISCDYAVVDHIVGIRPTVIDRKPLVGRHPVHLPLYVLNGLGSRGVMIAPYASQELYRSIEEGQDLHAEINITRFEKKHFKN